LFSALKVMESERNHLFLNKINLFDYMMYFSENHWLARG